MPFTCAGQSRTVFLFSESLKNFNISSNFTYVKSQVKYSQSEYDSRVRSARTGQTIDKYRDMAGQSPYLLNVGLSYDGGESGFLEGFETGLFYNVQGKTLQIVGISDRPDIYSNPFHSLNFTAGKQFKNGFGIGLKIDNLLNSKEESVYNSFEAVDQIYKRLEKGISYGFKLSYKF